LFDLTDSRGDSKPEPVKESVAIQYTPDQENMALEAAQQLRDIESLEELRNLYTGAQEAGILHVMLSGTSLNNLIGARKRELDGGN
jgi:hypothetical protein